MNFIVIIIGILIFSSFVYLLYNWNIPTETEPDEIIYFYKEGCPACTAFDNVWIKLTNNTNYNLSKINVQEISNLAFYYNVAATPTILIKKDNKWHKLVGNRDYDTLISEIRSFVSNFK